MYAVTRHLSEGSFVRNVVVQIPKFYAKSNPSSKLSPNPSPNTDSNPNPSPNPMPTRFGQMTLRTSELLPIYAIKERIIDSTFGCIFNI